jgi:hypothetical protein
MSAEAGSNGRLPMLVACYGPVGDQTASGNIPAIEIDILELATEVEPDCQGGGTKLNFPLSKSSQKYLKFQHQPMRVN